MVCQEMIDVLLDTINSETNEFNYRLSQGNMGNAGLFFVNNKCAADTMKKFTDFVRNNRAVLVNECLMRQQ